MSQLTVQLQQASQRFTMPGKLAGDEFDYDLAHGADVVSFTEVRTFHDQLRRAARRHHYQLVLPERSDTALAVLDAHHIDATGYVPSVNPVPGPAAEGGHGARGIQWVRWQPHGTKELVTTATGHWVTKASDDGHQQLAMTSDMADVMRHAARGTRLGFWTGDTNNNDRPQAVSDVDRKLRMAQLTSCWDELGRYPDTVPGATIDVVGSYDPDARVKCLRARVWHLLHSDHKSVSAWYLIRNVRR